MILALNLLPTARVIRVANLALAVVWAVMVPVSLITGWAYSVSFISMVSIYANSVSHLAAWRADVPNDEAMPASRKQHTMRASRPHWR